MTEPQTEAGKTLDRELAYDYRPESYLPGDYFQRYRTHILAIEAEARVGYVPASLSPEWHAELGMVEAESRNATLDEVVRVVEGLTAYHPHEAPYVGGSAELPCHATQCAGGMRRAVLDAVKALRA